MPLVVDASAVLSVALADEDADYGAAMLAAIGRDGAVVPTLFWFEVRNVLLMAERRRQFTLARTTAFLADLSLLPVTVDDMPREAVVLDLARRRALTVYDATYLELAQRRGVSLATLDRALAAAARLEGVPVYARPGARRRR